MVGNLSAMNGTREADSTYISILCGIHYAAEHDKLSGSLLQNLTPHMDFRRVLVPVLQPSGHLCFVKSFFGGTSIV